jgi:hypothetical protein
MSDTEILNYVVRELLRGRIIAEDWQREELLCEIKVKRMRDKAVRDKAIHDESEATRIPYNLNITVKDDSGRILDAITYKRNETR